MPVDLSDFDQIRSGDIEHFVREVNTPMPESEDGTGYTTEENLALAYRKGDTIVKAQKIGGHGWSLWKYTDESSERIVSRERGFDAMRKARRIVEEA